MLAACCAVSAGREKLCLEPGLMSQLFWHKTAWPSVARKPGRAVSKWKEPVHLACISAAGVEGVLPSHMRHMIQ